MAEVVFKDLKIQVGDRVKIPKAVVDTLGLKTGQKIILKFDPVTKEMKILEDSK